MTDESESESQSQSRRFWSDLPRDVLHLISKKLPDLRDFIRFRAVCPSWCSSAPLSDPPPQLPWILECSRDAKLQEELRFYSLSTGETGVIRVKESHRGKGPLGGPYCGYLLLRGEEKVRTPELENRVVLFNPLTNVDISLPPLRHSEYSYIRPVWTGTDPAQSRTIIFMDEEYRRASWVVYHPGMTEYIIMDKYCGFSCYWDGKIFAESIDEDTQVYDVISQKLLFEISIPEKSYDLSAEIIGDGLRIRSYLVELSGVIVRVSWYFYGYRGVSESYFRIYKLKFVGTKKEPCWVEISNIGNHILFLDDDNGFSLKPIAGFKGNCIYTFGCCRDTPCRYDIAARTFEMVPWPFGKCTWFVPSLF